MQIAEKQPGVGGPCVGVKQYRLGDIPNAAHGVLQN